MSSNAGCESVFSLPVAALEYRDIGSQKSMEGSLRSLALVQPGDLAGKRRAEVELSDADFAERIRQERTAASDQAEQKVRAEYEVKLRETRAALAEALTGFEVQRNDYFARVESEVVQLSLAIAAKILHREAQVDPMLVAALVRITIEKMLEGSSVTVRVGIGRGAPWREYFADQPRIAGLEIVEDRDLSQTDCVVETQVGTTNIGLDTQLKEVERGFFDLLALRPENR